MVAEPENGQTAVAAESDPALDAVRALIAAAHQPLAVFDRDGRCLAANRHYLLRATGMFNLGYNRDGSTPVLTDAEYAYFNTGTEDVRLAPSNADRVPNWGIAIDEDKVVVKLDRGERVSTLEIDIEMPEPALVGR